MEWKFLLLSFVFFDCIFKFAFKFMRISIVNKKIISIYGGIKRWLQDLYPKEITGQAAYHAVLPLSSRVFPIKTISRPAGNFSSNL